MKTKHILISILLVGRISVIFVIGRNKSQQIQIGQTQTTGDSTTYTGDFLETNKEKKTKAIADLDALKKIYEKNKSESILIQIIEKQAQNYQFNDAVENIKQIINPEAKIAPDLFLYIAINSSALKVSDPQSIDTIMQIVNTYKEQDLIQETDFVFYQGLKEIWNENYNQALIYRESIKESKYKPIIAGFEQAISSHKTEKSLPPEYIDGLVALSALKNGYFTVARKIAITCINKNEKYILPYQILAYSHFMSNNRDTAIDYFLKLADFDQNNKDMYNFLIGVSYYWKADYSSSAMYLTQVKKTNPTDTLRYLIQDYQQLKANDKAKQIRTILAKQNDINPSDFQLYFYSILYKSYFSMDQEMVKEYKDLSAIMIQNCEDRFPENDVCLYGSLAKSALENTIQTNERAYINLANTYNVSYIYHILGDYFAQRKDSKNAEETYAKAIAITDDKNEQILLREKVAQLK